MAEITFPRWERKKNEAAQRLRRGGKVLHKGLQECAGAAYPGTRRYYLLTDLMRDDIIVSVQKGKETSRRGHRRRGRE